MFFHVYADRAGAGVIECFVCGGFEKDPIIFDRSMMSNDICGESDRLLKGFVTFVKTALEQNANKVFIFDLFDCIDMAKGEELAKAFAPLFAAGVKIHAAAECGENHAVSAVLAAAEEYNYRTKITKAMPR